MKQAARQSASASASHSASPAPTSHLSKANDLSEPDDSFTTGQQDTDTALLSSEPPAEAPSTHEDARQTLPEEAHSRNEAHSPAEALFRNTASLPNTVRNNLSHGPAAYRAHQQPNAISAKEREVLILEHLPQVRLIARRIHDRLPESVILDDLISTGIVGLISAIDHFDAAHNVKLKTYAEYKIRGAILDSLRGLDWAPRQQRKRSKQIEAAITAVERRLHRSPTEEEIAAELGLKIEAYHEWLVEIRGLNLGSLESASPDEESRDLLKYVSDDEEAWPSRLLERSELKRLLAEAIAQMPEVEKTVLSLYYHEELTLREISKILKLHESRISQLKSQAILRLRAYMEKRWPTPRGL